MSLLKQKLLQVNSGTYYDLPSTLKQTPSFSFGIGDKKASYIFLQGTPSPAHYQLNRIYEHYEE